MTNEIKIEAIDKLMARLAPKVKYWKGCNWDVGDAPQGEIGALVRCMTEQWPLIREQLIKQDDK